LRPSVADFEVIEQLSPAGPTGARYLCRSPARLGLPEGEPVMVAEIRVGGDDASPAVDVLVRLAGIRSKHLLRLLEVGRDVDRTDRGDDDDLYLATERPSGSLIDLAVRLDPVDRVRAVADAALGAHALHEAGVAHGGIGPSSVLLTGRGAALGPPPVASRPGVITVLGDWTDVVGIYPGLLRGEAPTRSADVWSLAATLHLALSDRPLYRDIAGDAPVTAVQRVLFTPPQIDPDLPDGIQRIMAACFEPDPSNRPATASDLAARLTSTGIGR
jgi:eukaryotic-like serine/threonine-protein kinase